MKRFFSLIVSLVFLCSFAACSRNDGDGKSGTDTASFSGFSGSSPVTNSSVADSSVTDAVSSGAETDLVSDFPNSSASAEISEPLTPEGAGTDDPEAPEDTAREDSSPSSDEPEIPETPDTTHTPSSGSSSSSATVPPTPIANKLMAITDQKNDEIVVVNLDAEDITADSAVVWRWSVDTVGDVPHANLCRSRLDDVKLRDCSAWGGLVVGMTSSSGMVALVEYPSGKCLFSADMKGYGPHSIEILPNGLIAVAGSGNGNNDKSVIRIYRASTKTDTYYVELPLISAHGVTYDPDLDVLWGLGGSTLNAYKVGGSRQNPTLTLFKETGLSFSGGHDLSPVYGNSDLLWISMSGKVAQYSKSKNTLSYTYLGAAAISQKAVKSVNTYSDNVTVMTVADPNNGTASHNTDKVRIFRYVQNAAGAWLYKYVDIAFDGSKGTVARDFYKVRAFVADYQ